MKTTFPVPRRIVNNLIISCLVYITLLFLSGCEKSNQNPNPTITPVQGSAVDSVKTAEYHKLSQDEAKAIIDSGVEYILLDVRTQAEYDEKHIAGAILIPVDEIKVRAESELPAKNALIMVYCRTGVRSKNASESLVELGFVNVQDIGGISTWSYETE